MVFPCKYTHFGYEFLSKVDLVTLHSGVDLNYGAPWEDKGLPVKAIADGVVVASYLSSPGWGNMVVLFHHKYKTWSRYAHLEKNFYKEGNQVYEGDEIGTIGATGGNWSSHLHFDIIKKKLPSWTSYTKYWSNKKVRQYYVDPMEYIRGIQKQEDQKEEDQTVSPIHRPGADWCIENKITSGARPRDGATREEVWTMLKRLHEL